MQPDQIMITVSSALTFGWYAILHWGLGIF